MYAKVEKKEVTSADEKINAELEESHLPQTQDHPEFIRPIFFIDLLIWVRRSEYSTLSWMN